MYLLRHCILNRVTVVYDNVLQGTEWIFWKSGYCEETRRGDSNYKRSAALSDSNAVHIFDAAAGKQVFCPLSRARLAVFTSTGCEYSKQLDRMDILRIVFPTANLRDCLAMGSVMGIETEEICDRFNRYSGNLRLIFEYSNKNGAEAYIDRAVRGASMDALQKIAFGTAYGSHDPAGVSSALLIALLTDIDALNGGPPWTPERMQAIQEAYSRSVKWGIASKYILAKIAEATQSSAEDFVRNFATAAKGISLLSNTRGRVLELFAAADFAAGKTYTMRRLLPDGLGPEIQEYWPARELVEAGEITLSQLILQYGNNSEVIVNMCKNFKGIDLLRPPNDLLQLTVNAEHTVQVDVVAAIRKSNKNSTNSSSNNNRARRSAKKPTRFIFAVPEDCYHNFKKARSYVHRDDKGQQHQCAFEFLPAALKTQLEGVEQWVLCL